MNERYNRQIDIINQEELSFPIHVIGAGGIGSWTALLLAKMGCPQIMVYDDDFVEEHNIASQFFTINDNGILKTTALKNNVYNQTGINIVPKTNTDEEQIDNGLIIIAVDSMAERIRLADIYKDKNLYIIDGRMGGLQLEIYSCPSATYVATLSNPLDIVPEPCTARSICFNCAVIGGLIVNKVRQYAQGVIINEEYNFAFNTLEQLKMKI
jgi:tRNA A37 threonylcarbamoyladenosine dehydratase